MLYYVIDLFQSSICTTLWRILELFGQAAGWHMILSDSDGGNDVNVTQKTTWAMQLNGDTDKTRHKTKTWPTYFGDRTHVEWSTSRAGRKQFWSLVEYPKTNNKHGHSPRGYPVSCSFASTRNTLRYSNMACWKILHELVWFSQL